MRKPDVLKGVERQRLLDALHAKYAQSAGFGQRFTYLRKKYFWLIIVQGAKILKRIIDILGAIFFGIIFFPFIIIIALIIKLSDCGPVLYVTRRVGKWGNEFNFPKFRTMKVGADQMVDTLKEQNLIEGDIKFKMKEDPRITRFGRLLRKTSLDELPQLWCVLKGEMSLVGPRPPLAEEVAQYTIDQRRRLDITPGLTCIWQVSGRSELPFDKQVKLDIQYIESQSFWLDIKLLLKTIPAVIFGKGAY
ncbi:MAG: sugar transferase [Chlamydiales bacterium]|nr:sugar transferase [Chlamydiia bacterium]MCP5507956.1 sugar transferase [Chlamydiales bacterium]